MWCGSPRQRCNRRGMETRRHWRSVSSHRRKETWPNLRRKARHGGTPFGNARSCVIGMARRRAITSKTSTTSRTICWRARAMQSSPSTSSAASIAATMTERVGSRATGISTNARSTTVCSPPIGWTSSNATSTSICGSCRQCRPTRTTFSASRTAH